MKRNYQLNTQESPPKVPQKERKQSPAQNGISTQKNQIALQNKLIDERKNELLTSFDINRGNSNQIKTIEQFSNRVDNHKRIQNMQKKNLAENEDNLFYNPNPNPFGYIEKKGDQTLNLTKMMLENGQLKNRSLSISDKRDDLLLFYKYKSGFNKSQLSSLERSSFAQHLQQLQIRQQQKKVIGDLYQKNSSLSPPNSHITYRQTNIQSNPKHIIKLNPTPPQPKKKKIVVRKNQQISPNKRKLTTDQSNEVLVPQQEKFPTQFFYSRQHQLNQLDSSFGSGQSFRVCSNIGDTQTSRVKKQNPLKDSQPQHFQMHTEPNKISIAEIENENFSQKDYYNPEPFTTIDDSNTLKANGERIHQNLNMQNNKSSPFLNTIREENNNKINLMSQTINIEEREKYNQSSRLNNKIDLAQKSNIQINDQSQSSLQNQQQELQLSPSKQSRLFHQGSNLSSISNSPLKRQMTLQEKSAVQSKTSLVNLDMLEKDLIDIQKEYQQSNSPLKRTFSYEQSPIKSINQEQKQQNSGTQRWLKKPSQYTIINNEIGYSPEKAQNFENKQLSSSRSLQDQSISPQTSPKRRGMFSQRQSIERVIQSKANQPYLEDKFIHNSKDKYNQSSITEEDQFQSSAKEKQNQYIDNTYQSLNSIPSINYDSPIRKSQSISVSNNQLIKPFKLQRSQNEFELNLPQSSKQKNVIQQNVLQEGYGVSLVTQFQHLQNKKVDVKAKDETTEEEIEEENSDLEGKNQIIEDYKSKGLLKDRHFIKYHKEIINMLQAYEKDGITKKQSQELLNLIYRAKKYENFSQLMNGCEEFQNDLNSLDQNIKEETESIEQKKDNLAQILDVLNDIEDIDPNQQKDQLKIRLQDLKKIKVATIQNTKDYIKEMNQLKSQEKVYQVSGLDKRKFLKSNLDKLKKQRQKHSLEQFKKVCKTENVIN